MGMSLAPIFLEQVCLSKPLGIHPDTPAAKKKQVFYKVFSGGKEWNQQGDMDLINLYAHHNIVQKHIKQEYAPRVAMISWGWSVPCSQLPLPQARSMQQGQAGKGWG